MISGKIFLTQKEWARRCGYSKERARQVLEFDGIEGAVLLRTANGLHWIVPEGTPWPVGKRGATNG